MILLIYYGFIFSGKSTLISALSGHMVPSGNIFIGGINLAFNSDIVHSMVGVCPQEDIVWSELNVQEHLTFQARQRGVNEHRIWAEVQRVAIMVNLDGDALLTPASKLSGGMRRRLSIGMCIVGDPPILFLDECSAGLDPENKHQIWRIIQTLKSPERCILLTTHSMEECETLCSRIGILVNGRLQCVGTSIHLKGTYGHGYTITVNRITKQLSDAAESDNLSKLNDFIINNVAKGSAKVVSVVNNTTKYRIDKDTRSISEIFAMVESSKADYQIREWGISMATMEEVFISAVERANSTAK